MAVRFNALDQHTVNAPGINAYKRD